MVKDPTVLWGLSSRGFAILAEVAARPQTRNTRIMAGTLWLD